MYIDIPFSITVLLFDFAAGFSSSSSSISISSSSESSSFFSRLVCLPESWAPSSRDRFWEAAFLTSALAFAAVGGTKLGSSRFNVAYDLPFA